MLDRARRFLCRAWIGFSRRALLAMCLLPTEVGAEIAPERIVGARYVAPTERYTHGVLGDAVEWGGLELTLKNGRKILMRLPQNRVFEDISPRLVDVDGDDAPEVIVVETDLRRGARLAVYSVSGRHAATPYIGRPNRWLAPIGAVDLDGDGAIEIAYIDRPHLARRLRIWRYTNGVLTPVADQVGLSNHRIGDAYISGGIRTCGLGPEIITANSDWTRVTASRLTTGRIVSRDIGPLRGKRDFDAALACR